jgi:hypothetical protein
MSSLCCYKTLWAAAGSVGPRPRYQRSIVDNQGMVP